MIERADLSQYNPAYDSQRFTALMAQRGTEGFYQRLIGEKARIEQQLKTDIGERLDVAKSTFVYEIRGGKLYEPGRDEPFEDVIKRGMGKNPIDAQRDEAELKSFTGVVQGFLAKDETQDGTTVSVVSPRGKPGSNEQKNFFQVYIREGRYVIGARYYSDLTNSEYRGKITSINPAYSELLPDNPTDVDLKSTPVIVPAHLDYSADPDKLAKFLLGKEIGMPEEKLEQIIMSIAPVTTSYINTLVENPEALEDLETDYVAHLNAAYVASESEHLDGFYSVENMKKALLRAANVAQVTMIEESTELSRTAILYLASEPVKIGGGACGSGSCSTSTESSSGDVPSDPLDNLDGRGRIHFACPECGAINKRKLFQYVTLCKNCKSDKVLPAQLRDKIFQPGQTMKQ